MKIQFTTTDQVSLAGQLIEAKAAKAVVLINPGTATKTSFYLPFAQFLAEHGYHVLLWNYRGCCESRTGSIKHSAYRYADIGNYDIPAAINQAKALFPELPLYCIGHSAGGQQIGFTETSQQLAGLIAVAVSAGHMPHMPLGYRLQANLFFRVIVPLSVRLCGYVPAKKLKLMEDLPSQMAIEWGNWCKEDSMFFSPKYYAEAVPNSIYQQLGFPVHVITASDDEISTPKNTENLWKHIHSQHGISFKSYDAASSPKRAIGHFGYFRKANQHIWQDILQQLQEFQQR